MLYQEAKYILALDFIFKTPSFNSQTFAKETGIVKGTSTRILADFCAQGILKLSSKASGSKPAFYDFEELINLVSD